MSDQGQKFFRGSLLGGFNRRDVLYYVEKASGEFKEETDALHEQLGLLRTQCDELRYRVGRTESEKMELTEKISTLEKSAADDAGRIERMTEQISGLKEENAALSESLSGAGASLRQAKEELESQKERSAGLEKTAAEFESTRLRIADIELKAYARADEIERQALHNAQEIREAMRDAVLRAAEQYGRVRSEAESTAAHVNEELERIRGWLMSFGDLFSDLDRVIEQLDAQARQEDAAVRNPEGSGVQ